MYQLIEFQNAEEFWIKTSVYLRNNEAENALFLGLANLFRVESRDCLYQSVLFNEGLFVGALMCCQHNTNRNLIITRLTEEQHAEIIFNKFKDKKIDFNALVGELSTVDLYKSVMTKMELDTKVLARQGIYRCRKVIRPEQQKDIFFRKAEESDIPEIAKWIEDFHAEAIPHDPPINGIDEAKKRINKGMIFVIEKSGTLVSMAGWSRDIGSSVSVNLVFTPKPMRKNGYASTMVASLTQHLLNCGKGETNLYTDLNNPTSNKIYQDLGYEFICNSIHLGVSGISEL